MYLDCWTPTKEELTFLGFEPMDRGFDNGEFCKRLNNPERPYYDSYISFEDGKFAINVYDEKDESFTSLPIYPKSAGELEVIIWTLTR